MNEIANNIKFHASRCSTLFIWTDCDREGENIGAEIRDIAQSVNPRIEVSRAHFSNVERAWVVPWNVIYDLTILGTSFRLLRIQLL
jgi:DNA topoisomerase IA